MTETMCTSGAVKLKAGTNVATLTAAQYTQLINQAESYINAQTRINYTDTYSALNADVKKILEQVCSDMAGIYAISFDMSGYTTLAEAQTILDVLWANASRGLTLLKDKKQTDFIDGA